MTTLTPDALAELREVTAGGPCTLADRALVALKALSALLDAAEELERVKKWGAGRCNTCAFVGKKSCPKKMFDGEPRWAATNPCNGWKPGWNKEAAR